MYRDFIIRFSIKYILIGLLCFNSLAIDLPGFFLETNHQLTLVGETHTDDLSRDRLTNSLHEFIQSGGEVLALEMIESHQQVLLDDFLKRKDQAKENLSSYLERRWGYNTSNYMKLITQASSLGLDILAIDLEKDKRPLETELFPVNPWISKVRAAREAHMAKILCEYKDLKTIVLIGSFHVIEEFLPTALSNECQLRSHSIKLRQ